MAGKFEYAQAEEIRDAFAKHEVRYLFLGKSGAILLGYPDTTQDADLYVEKSPENGARIVTALAELGFELTDVERTEIQRGKDFVQLKTGPFDLDLVFDLGAYAAHVPTVFERLHELVERRQESVGV